MELNEQSTEETENKADEKPAENSVKEKKIEDIIYKLVMNKELDEKDREIIDSIVEKKDEKIYGNENKEVSREDEES